MIEMASSLTNGAAFASSMLAVAGGIVSQVAPSPAVADTGMYIGAGGLAAALALLVSSLGDKVGPHVVAIAKLIVESRESYLRLKGENLALAHRIVEMETRLARTESEAATAKTEAEKAKEVANQFENKLIDLRARANARFNAVEANVEDIHQRVDLAGGSKDNLPVVTDEIPPAPPAPESPP